MRYERGSEGVSAAPVPPRPVRLLDEVRRCLRLKHYSLRTEQAYTGWIRRFILANGKRHPRDMGGPEVERHAKEHGVRLASPHVGDDSAFAAMPDWQE